MISAKSVVVNIFTKACYRLIVPLKGLSKIFIFKKEIISPAKQTIRERTEPLKACIFSLLTCLRIRRIDGATEKRNILRFKRTSILKSQRMKPIKTAPATLRQADKKKPETKLSLSKKSNMTKRIISFCFQNVLSLNLVLCMP